MIRTGALMLAFVGHTASAQGLSFPNNATLETEIAEGTGSYDVPMGPFADGGVPSELATGQITRQVWRVRAAGLTTFQLMEPLKLQLEMQGFSIVFECETQGCGGFDFRFGIDVLDPPEMFVDLGDFRFLTALRGDEAVTLLASRSARAGFVQLVSVGATEMMPSVGDAPAIRSERLPVDLSDFGAALEAEGHVVLADLTFATGSSDLGEGPFESLNALAAYLIANPDRSVALVGHTDAEGSLDGNIALSRRRASSVLERLARQYDVPRGQMEAQGMGYLSPVASNLTEEGREANRRVEVIVTTTP